MRVIIAGSRTIRDYKAICSAIWLSGFVITEVVSGTASGVDSLGERWATEKGIPIKRFSAEWEKYGRSAGPRRNKQMAVYANALILVWDGKSSGSRHMLCVARTMGLRVAAFLYQCGNLRHLKN